ncbi:hypothetical protein ACIQW5_18395 [Methylorubrum thiocyanatum]|uniref:hypothetical protein n=1 Tax=Methylorubrum thiocyanatum TaxID=47958 RepID=UPI00383AA947
MPLSHDNSPCNTSKIAPAGRPGFRSFKTSAPIAYPARWHRDLLIQASLDPRIEAIEPVPDIIGDGSAFSIIVHIDATRRLITAVREPTVRRVGIIGLEEAVLPRSVVLAEPRCSDARAIWSMRRHQVTLGNRLRILRALEDQPDGMTLARTADLVRGGDIDPTEAVLALACAGLVDIDLRGPLAPSTPVRRRICVSKKSPIPITPGVGTAFSGSDVC